MDKRPKPACAERPGLGLILRVHKLLSSALLVSFGKHTRNTLKDTKVPAVPAIRTGQDLSLLDCKQQGPDPDGWETMRDCRRAGEQVSYHDSATPAWYAVINL